MFRSLVRPVQRDGRSGSSIFTRRPPFHFAVLCCAEAVLTERARLAAPQSPLRRRQANGVRGTWWRGVGGCGCGTTRHARTCARLGGRAGCTAQRATGSARPGGGPPRSHRSLAPP
jgi:hypothetical protein